jgi:hypothetical protein
MKNKYVFGIGLFLLITAFVANGADAQVYSSGGTSSVQVSLLNQNPDPAVAGQIVELRFSVENTGGASANGLLLELQPSYPFSKIPGELYVQNISSLQGYQQGAEAAIVKFKVMVDKDAAAGSSKITLVQSSASSGTSLTQDFGIGITSRQFAQIVIDKSRISPGNETDLIFTIHNTGSSPLKNLVFSWDEPKGAILPVFSDDTKYVNYVDIGGTVNLDYRVVADVNAVPGLYQLNLDIKFDSENGTAKEIQTKAGIFVGGGTDFDVTYAESSSGQISLSVANIGNNPAYSVTVRVPQQDGFLVTGSSSSIIGNLDKGDYTIVSFTVSSSGAAGNRTGAGGFQQARAGNVTGATQRTLTPLKVLVDYTDTTGERHSVEKSVPIQPSSSTTSATGNGFGRQSGNNSTLLTAAIIVAAVACGGGYYLYRRRKKKKKALRHKGSVSLDEA